MSASPTYAIGSLVSARGREWVVLPGGDDDLLLLRPLGGTESDATGLYLPLEGDDVRPAEFALPGIADMGDSTSARLLRDAVRFTFRAGAGPFRSLGRIAVEPRPYQLVPLLMALKLSPVRLLIADDVGIGKTVEAGLIARELLDRGEISRIAVICPPHLCEQWQRELASKFHIDAVVVRPGTVTRLERGLALNESLFDVYPFVIVSIDYIKTDRRRADFIRACPEFVIVDEAHTAASGGDARSGQHQRHALVREIAADPHRHLVLTTATPHSGIEAAFRSLLVLLDEAFGALSEEETIASNDPLRLKLAEHFVQRRRADIADYLDDVTLFPKRIAREEHYTLDRDYQAFYDRVLAYATELVRSAEGLSRYRQRVCWWAALALMRCATSSPAAAAETLRRRAAGLVDDDNQEMALDVLDALGERSVLDLDTSEAADQDDVVPGADTVDEDSAANAERRRLLAMARQADELAGEPDRKLQRTQEIVADLVERGFHPVVFCRYISTADYVADTLRSKLKGVEIDSVTGRLPAEERALRVEALGNHDRRVLVATDCLSEGINLQQHFDAVVHYDLSWNPTRHEQRDGRVDRFGQASREVETVLLFGDNNRVDGAIMRVLLRKAETIRKTLGISVPVPADSTKVMEAIFESLFLRAADPRQLEFDFGDIERRLDAVNAEWDRNAERERRSRTIFAQGSIKPEQVREELQESQRALGDSQDVERFVRDALQRLDAPLGTKNGRPVFNPDLLPTALRESIPFDGSTLVGFTLPLPEKAVHLARTGEVVEALASWLTDTALDPLLTGPAARSGAMITTAVATRTTLLLLRARMHLEVTREGQSSELLAEEMIVAAYEGRGAQVSWLEPDEAETLLDAEPAGNMPPEIRERRLTEALDDLPLRGNELDDLARERATQVLAAHRRVRDAARISGIRYQAKPVLPVDVLGLYVLMPKAMVG